MAMVSRQICTCGAQGSDLLWGIPPTHSVQAWIPLMVFAFLFGLSMDYEVFVLSRIREEYDPTGSTATAVVEAPRRTGRLVTSAALIPVLAFISMASAPGTDIKMFATALAAGIFLDAPSSAGIARPAPEPSHDWHQKVRHHGIARAIEPSHTLVDGEALVAASCGTVEAPLELVCALAARGHPGGVCGDQLNVSKLRPASTGASPLSCWAPMTMSSLSLS